jgi:hypothetical protein
MRREVLLFELLSHSLIKRHSRSKWTENYEKNAFWQKHERSQNEINFLSHLSKPTLTFLQGSPVFSGQWKMQANLYTFLYMSKMIESCVNLWVVNAEKYLHKFQRTMQILFLAHEECSSRQNSERQPKNEGEHHEWKLNESLRRINIKA